MSDLQTVRRACQNGIEMCLRDTEEVSAYYLDTFQHILDEVNRIIATKRSLVKDIQLNRCSENWANRVNSL